MIIALGRCESTHGSSCLGEEIIQLTSGITVVFTKYKLIEKKRRSKSQYEELVQLRGNYTKKTYLYDRWKEGLEVIMDHQISLEEEEEENRVALSINEQIVILTSGTNSNDNLYIQGH